MERKNHQYRTEREASTYGQPTTRFCGEIINPTRRGRGQAVPTQANTELPHLFNVLAWIQHDFQYLYGSQSWFGVNKKHGFEPAYNDITRRQYSHWCVIRCPTVEKFVANDEGRFYGCQWINGEL